MYILPAGVTVMFELPDITVDVGNVTVLAPVTDNEFPEIDND